MADTPLGETVTPESLSNDGQPAATPVVNAADPAEVEKARKEAEQARMYANQLENKLKAKEAEEQAAKAKQLEEKEEFKTLYEQTNAKLNEVLETQQSQERQKELATATDEVFKQYDPKAVELAKVAGLSLSDTSEVAQAALKEKLDVFQKQLGSSAPIPGSNNPHQPAPSAINREELVRRDENGISPMALAGAKGNDKIALSYIRDLPAIQRMKEIARNGA